MILPEFQKQNQFFAKMLEDYQTGNFIHPEVFAPYMNWKLGQGLNITRQQARAMMSEAQEQLSKYYDKYPHAYDNMDTYINDDPWQSYKGFGEDKYMVSYLEGIDEELTNILGILR